jgi:hypothetical protein
MTPRTPQCEVFCLLLLSFKHSGVPEDYNSRLFQVLGFTPTLGQSRGATPTLEAWTLVLGPMAVVWLLLGSQLIWTDIHKVQI